MFDGVELGGASEHDDGAWLSIIAGPTARSCEDPCGIGQRTGRVWVLLLRGLAFDTLTDPFQGRLVGGIEDIAERTLGFSSRSSTSCMTLTAAIKMAVMSFSSGPSCSWRSASTSKPSPFQKALLN